MEGQNQAKKEMELDIHTDFERYYRRPTYHDGDAEDEFDVNGLSLSSHSEDGSRSDI